jgi:hypothetical protein
MPRLWWLSQGEVVEDEPLLGLNRRGDGPTHQLNVQESWLKNSPILGKTMA